MGPDLRQLKLKIFKYRIKQKYRRNFNIGAISFVALIVLSLLVNPISQAIDSLKGPSAIGKIKVNWYKDLNAVHLRVARSRGIKPFKSTEAFRDGIDAMLDEHRLVKVSNNRFYVLKRLTHSHPYLRPVARNFLDDLGKRYRQKLDKNGMGDYLFQVSSLLRTKESQKNLSKSNVNASSNTSHLYGMTFDIAYRSVVKKPLPWMKVEVADAKAIKLLSETIGDMRREGRCVVVTERIEKCFHITVVR